MLAALKDPLSEEGIISPHASQRFSDHCFHAVSRLLACLEQCSALWALSQPNLLTFKTPNSGGESCHAGLTQKGNCTRAQGRGTWSMEF